VEISTDLRFLKAYSQHGVHKRKFIITRNDLNCETVSGGVILTTASTLDVIGIVSSADTKMPRNSISVRNREHLIPFVKRSYYLKESKTFSNFSRCSWGSSVLVKMQMSSTYTTT
jgi:hypothetical protein